MQQVVRCRRIGLFLLLGAIACTSSATATPPIPDASSGRTAVTEPAPPTSVADGRTLEPPSVTPAFDLPDDPTELMRATIYGPINEITRKMVDSGNQSYIPVLLDLMRIEQHPDTRYALVLSINRLVEGPDAVPIPAEQTDWGWWVEWLGKNPQITPPEGYAGWKGELFSILDAGLGGFLYEGVKTEIRLEEVVWGGVAKDGIPDLRNPPVVPANEAWYMRPSDRVFGVSINGENRAYPLRILNAHEMANDVVGGVPFALAY